MKKNLITATVLITLLAACASTKMGTIIPQPGGMYQAIGIGSTNNEALEQALFSAESTCKKIQRRHVVMGQQTKYKGLVSEDTNKAVNKAAEVAATVAGAWLPTLSNDDDYQITLSFRCES